jgi:hypothetical protein
MDNSGMEVSPEVVQAQVEPVQKPTERTFTQSELNEIVGRVRGEEARKRENMISQSQNANHANYAEMPTSPKALSEDDVKRLTGDELNRRREEWEKETIERQHAEAAQRIVESYKEKIAPGKEKYQDFDAVTNTVDMRYYPNVVQLLAEHVDNAHDILYDLAKNRTKLYQLESTCAHNPQDAIYEIRRLSESIKANDDASKMRQSNAPLSQQRPSNTGMDSGGALSMNDLKRKYRG